MIENEIEFQKIHDAFRTKIHRYLTRLVGEYEAEDLTQEVFVKVSQALKNFRGDSQLSTWIYRIATNVALDRLRSPSFKRATQKRSATISGVETDIEDKEVWTGQKSPSIEETLIREEMWGCLRDFVDKLPANYRTVIVLSLLEGMKNNEIAEILGATLETVKIRLHRGRTKLRKELMTHCGLNRDMRKEIYWDGKRI
jgi:RNA polymerase sigma-70 factor (ECF subfamily)